MKVLILGANGQLGSDLVRAAGQGGGGFDVQPFVRGDLDVTRLAEIPSVLSSIDFDVLINCTSYHKVDEVEANAGLAFTVNAHAVDAIAGACRDKGARLIHISTDYVFDGSTDRPYVETDSPGPLSVYGASKLMGERLAALRHKDTLILRVASLYGVAGASGKGGNFVETIIRIGKDKGSVTVVDDMTMSPTSTEDVAWMVLKLLETDAPAGTYHAVNSEHATWFEFATEIIARAGVAASVQAIRACEYPYKAVRPPYSVLDNAKVAGVVGDVPGWQDALDRYLRAKGHVPG